MVLLQDCEVGSAACGAGDCRDGEFGVDGGAMGVLCEVRGKRMEGRSLQAKGHTWNGQEKGRTSQRWQLVILMLLERHLAMNIGYCKDFLYNSPPQSLKRAAACSGVMSLCGSAINSYPTKNFLTVALLNKGG